MWITSNRPDYSKLHFSIAIMDPMSSSPLWEFHEMPTLCLVSMTVGVLSHITYYVRDNYVHAALSIGSFHLAAGSAVYLASIWICGVTSGAFIATAMCFFYLTGLFMSIAVYRIWFHPFAHFPGPFAAKLSKFYAPWIARHGRMHLEHTNLLKKYGNYVRIGALFLRVSLFPLGYSCMHFEY